MPRRDRLVVHEPRQQHLRPPQRGHGLVRVEAVGADEPAVVDLGNHAEHVGEIAEADAGPLDDAGADSERRTAAARCPTRSEAAPGPRSGAFRPAAPCRACRPGSPSAGSRTRSRASAGPCVRHMSGSVIGPAALSGCSGADPSGFERQRGGESPRAAAARRAGPASPATPGPGRLPNLRAARRRGRVRPGWSRRWKAPCVARASSLHLLRRVASGSTRFYPFGPSRAVVESLDESGEAGVPECAVDARHGRRTRRDHDLGADGVAGAPARRVGRGTGLRVLPDRGSADLSGTQGGLHPLRRLPRPRAGASASCRSWSGGVTEWGRGAVARQLRGGIASRRAGRFRWPAGC